MRIGKKAAALALALALALGPALPARADENDVEELEGQLESLQVQAEAQQQRTEEIQSNINTVSDQIRMISEEVSNAQTDYRQVKKLLDETNASIARNQELLEQTNQELGVKNKLLQRRVRDIYMHGRISYIDVLFGAADYNDLMTRMELLSRVIRSDYDLLKAVREKKQTVEETQAALEREREERAVLVKEAEEKELALRLRRQEKDKLLDKMQMDMELSQQAYEEILEASRRIEQLIQQSQYRYPGTPPGSGAMIWPIAGEITSEYGWRTHPITGEERKHNGIDIGGDYDEPICAAAAGQVSYAGWIDGYGYTVMIDHGGGIQTLYGHNEALAVTEGQNVAQGEVIAYCGSTGYSTGPHCHFEVRENGEPVDPWGYL